MRVIITGSQKIDDPNILKATIKESGFNITQVFNTGARGIEFQAQLWANDHAIPFFRFIPDWRKYGNRAGFFSAIEMAEQAEACIIIQKEYNPIIAIIKTVVSERSRTIKLFIKDLMFEENEGADA